MASIYGQRWTSRHDGDEAAILDMATWRDGLAGVGDFVIKRAIDDCVRAGGEWPPSLGAFRAMCVGMQGEAAERARQRGDSVKALPPPDTDPNDPIARLFGEELDKTKRRIRENYGDAPDGGYRDFLDQCELQGMGWMKKHFTRAEATKEPT